MPWVIEARNNEIAPEYVEALSTNPHKYAWDRNWYVVDRNAVEKQDVSYLIRRAFSMWTPMEPTSLEECTEQLVSIAKNTLEALNKDVDSVYALVQWRLRNIVTGEIIPGEVFSV